MITGTQNGVEHGSGRIPHHAVCRSHAPLWLGQADLRVNLEFTELTEVMRGLQVFSTRHHPGGPCGRLACQAVLR
jgi:hypothetical protein